MTLSWTSHLLQNYVSTSFNTITVELQPALNVSEAAKEAYPYDVPAPGNYIAGGARNFLRKAQSGKSAYILKISKTIWSVFLSRVRGMYLQFFMGNPNRVLSIFSRPGPDRSGQILCTGAIKGRHLPPHPMHPFPQESL